MEIPVYGFTGFLDGGKTSFVHQTLCDTDFNSGERTLLLVLEEGEVAYDLPAYPGDCIFLEMPEEISTESLDALAKKHQAERVLVEFNGMEKIEPFYEMMPQEWVPAQEVCMMDSNTIMVYNANMREMVVEKILGADLVVFNRIPVGGDIMPYHQLVRAISRQPNIAYEFVDGSTQYDDIVDPLPFDRDADAMVIADDDFALWYRDLTEEQEEYDGKMVTFKAQIAQLEVEMEGYFAPGRFVMTCCADDIEFMAVPCHWEHAETFAPRDWVMVTAKVVVEDSPIYGEVGPVLYATNVEPAQPADPDVAQF